MWCVLETATTRYLIFRGYYWGNALPLPAWTTVNGVRLHAQQYEAWRRAHPAIMECVAVPREVVLSGYSVGASCAAFTAMAARRPCRVCLFAPFPFCEPRFFDNLRQPYLQVYIRGDWLVDFYRPVFPHSARNARVVRPYAFCPTIYHLHNSRVLALSLEGCAERRSELREKMRECIASLGRR